MITVMCLQFAFLLITRVTMWLRLSQRGEAWKTTEILILRHQLAILQRRQLRRPVRRRGAAPDYRTRCRGASGGPP
jgi:hypothetical protein